MRNHLSLTLIILALAVPAAQAGMYKWTDDQGKVHYSDQVPPEAVRNEHEVLNSEGQTVQKIQRAKTKAEIRAEEAAKAKAEAERKREEAARKKQEDYDRTLLLTFTSLDDMKRARDQRIGTIESNVKIIESRIDSQQAKVDRLQEQAARVERSGHGSAKDIYSQIDGLRKQINAGKSRIRTLKAQERDIREKFAKDMARFKALKTKEREQRASQQ